MALPIVLRLAVDESRTRRARLGALALLPIYLVTIGLTYSRGAVIAGAVGVAVTMLVAGSRLRTLVYLALGLAASAPALAIGLSTDSLTQGGLPLSEREGDAAILALVAVASMVLLAIAGHFLLRLEARTPPSPARSRRIARWLGVAVAVAALAGVVAMGTSDRGFSGTISQAWDDFRAPSAEPALLDPSRLVSKNAGNRWTWWSEAVGAWSDKPLAGWGAGSFPVVHRQYRTHPLDVLQPHSVPLQFLSETGIVGFVLGMGGLVLLLIGAVAVVRRLVPGPERGLAAAMLGAAVAWLVHTGYDWDWDLPGVTLPALIMLGLLCARGGAWRRPETAGAPPGLGRRVALLGGATLLLATAAISAALPSWAETETDGALASVERRATPERLRQAQIDADLASRLDPVSYEPLLAASSLAQRRGRSAQAREYLMDAVRRGPHSVTVWTAVARFELARGDTRNLRFVVRRLLELDPRNRMASLVLALEQVTSVPAAGSATATGTPLVAVFGQTPATRRLLEQQGQTP
jgi:O-antigen ligase